MSSYKKEIYHGEIHVATIVKPLKAPSGLNFATDDDKFIQLGIWNWKKNKTLDAHFHNWFKREAHRTNEFIYVVKGKVKTNLFTEEGDFIWQSAPEMQVLDNISHQDGLRDETSAGALYDLIPTIREAVKPLGEYNKVRIVSKNRKVQHWLNEMLILEYDYGSEEFNKLVSNSKFRDMPFFAKAYSGKIGLQGDHGEVWYRNEKIKKL